MSQSSYIPEVIENSVIYSSTGKGVVNNTSQYPTGGTMLFSGKRVLNSGHYTPGASSSSQNSGGSASYLGQSSGGSNTRNVVNSYSGINGGNSGYIGGSNNYGGGSSNYGGGSINYVGPNHGNSHNRFKKNNFYCDFCHFKGHTRETCYKLIGYPADFKTKKKYHNSPSGNAAFYSHDKTASGGSTTNFAGSSHMHNGANTNSHMQGLMSVISQFTQE
ncbi:glycine-rich RNA-binding protein 1-like [Lycium barbarum]|uniref:glycine-rich RNA-binding protein 1-like n=1 Tax=Lycium barbarum TaxID=112863 RepID=UPI00293F3263|nr:glycine-rich RNA-binding protein 1-like [Lycium barbarum]